MMYRLYVDEVGTDTLKNLDTDRDRFLSLTGIAMKVDHAREHLAPAIEKLKYDLFPQDPDDPPLVLHRKEIMGGKGCFGRVRSDDAFRDTFNTRILDIYRNTQYNVITALIDKRWMADQRHWDRRHPYHYLLEILVEKFVQFLERKRAIGDIMPESRQGKDALLQKEYDRIRKDGTQYVKADRIASALRGSKLKFRTKAHNIAGLQLCDMLAHPSHIYVRDRMGHKVALGPFARIVCEILVQSKYDRAGWTGQIKGYGYKHLPS